MEAKQLLSFLVCSGPQNSFILSVGNRREREKKPFFKAWLAKNLLFFTNMKFSWGFTQKKRLLFFEYEATGEGWKNILFVKGGVFNERWFVLHIRKRWFLLYTVVVFFKICSWTDRDCEVHERDTHTHSLWIFFCQWKDSYTDARLARFLSYCFKYKRGIRKKKRKKEWCFLYDEVPQGVDDNDAR